MLRKLKENEFEKYVSWAYELALDLTRASFPIYADGIKTKEMFIKKSQKGLKRKNEEILLYEQNGSIEGWIHYFVIEDDAYIGVNNILVKNGYANALEELLNEWKKNFAGYSWHLYFPKENKTALEYMKTQGYSDRGQSVVDVLLFKDYEYQVENPNVVPIIRENYEVFRQIHSYFDRDMYWSSDKILKTFEDWLIYVYMENGRCLSTLYYNGKGNADLEIFGMDGEAKSEIIEALLISGLNEGKRIGARSMYFFNEEETHKLVENLGFTCVTVAHYFSEVC